MKKRFEKIGLSLTLICAIHCIATPILIAFLPLLGKSFTSFQVYENPLLFASFILAYWILYNDFHKHKNPNPLVLVTVAATIKSIEFFMGYSKYDAIIGPSIAILITIAYYLNWKHRKKCHCPAVH